eukprot:Hpha_TRINITY_DN30570_c0_g1::TRINITY_DN30570_c0_g1_i1::g.193765::m.193765/K05011/CLCN2; chloride channel 2
MEGKRSVYGGCILIDEWSDRDSRLTTEEPCYLCSPPEPPAAASPTCRTRTPGEPGGRQESAVLLGDRQSTTYQSVSGLGVRQQSTGAAFFQQVESKRPLPPGTDTTAVIIVGAAAALTAAVMNWGVLWVLAWKGSVDFGLELLWRVGFAALAVVVTNFESKSAAAGSGIPQVRALLQGISVHSFFRLSTLAAKLAGLFCVFLAGFPVGSEGPFMHATAIAMVQVLRFLPTRSASSALNLVTAACASGVAANFGAPLAGVLFAIELSHSFYKIPGLLLSVVGAVAGALFVKALRLSHAAALFSSDLEKLDSVDALDIGELCLVLTVGVVCGLMASLFVALVTPALRLKSRYFLYPGLTPGQWWARAILATCIVASMQCFVVSQLRLESLTEGHRGPLTDLFSVQGATPGRIPSYRLVRFMIARMVVCPLASILPIPCGVALPSFEIGATLGRLVSHAAQPFMSTCGVDCAVRLSMAGGAAFCAATTHTLSPGLLVLELTGQGQEAVKVLTAVVVALMISRSLVGSVFDVSQDVCAVPSIPTAFGDEESAARPVRDISQSHWISLKVSDAHDPPQHTQLIMDEYGNFVSAPGKLDAIAKACGIADHFGLDSMPLTRAAKGSNGLIAVIPVKDIRLALEKGRGRGQANIYTGKVNWSPLTVNEFASLEQVGRLFSALSPSCLYVLSRGDLHSVLTKERWIRQMNGASEKAAVALDAFKKLLGGIKDGSLKEEIERLQEDQNVSCTTPRGV